MDKELKQQLAGNFERQIEEKDEMLRVLQTQIAALRMEQNSAQEAVEKNKVLTSQVRILLNI